MSTVPKVPASRTNSPLCDTPCRALLIDEILEMILDELVHDKRSISHLAYACKAISEPSLYRLWTLNDSLEPFISLLPKELVLDEDSVFRFDQFTISNLPPEKWATFDKYAQCARRLNAKTVTMNPHRVYSSIFKQLIDLRPNIELFPNLTTLAIHVKGVPNPRVRMFPSSLRSVTVSWANIGAPEIEAILCSSIMNQLFLDAPFIEHVHFEGSPKEPLHSLTPLPFQRLRKITIKPSPLGPNVLHKYSHALSASAIEELDLRFVRWPDFHFQPISPVFPSLRKLTIDGSPSNAIDFVRLLSSPTLHELAMSSQCERSEDALTQYTHLLLLLADKYRGIFRTFKVQHPLFCHDQVDLESFLHAVRTLADAGAGTLQLSLVVGRQNLTHEVQDMISPLRWTALKHFRISFRRASASRSWTASNVLFV